MALKVCTGTTSQPYVHVQARLSQACTVTATGADAPLITNATGLADGTYSISLQATNDLTPTGTYYTVTEYLGSTDNTFAIQVPTTVGPFLVTNILVTPPTTVAAGPNHLSTLIVDGTSTLTGSIVEGKDFQRSSQTVTETVLVSGIDATLGEQVSVTLTANRVVGLPLNPVTGQELQLRVTQGGAGSFTLTWPAGIKTAWQPAPAVGAISTLTIRYYATAWQQVSGQVAVSDTGVAVHQGSMVVRDLTVAPPGGPYVGKLPGAPTIDTPAGVVTGKVWDFGGELLNVAAFNAKLDGVTDDTNAWYKGDGTGALEKVPATGGKVLHPGGVSVISASCIPKLTPTCIEGIGMMASIFKAANTVSGSGVRGLIDFQGASTSSGFQIRDVGFDLTGNTDSTVCGIHQSTGFAMQHAVFERLWFDLLGGANAHSGLHLENLGAGGATPSYDITIDNLRGHNGAATVYFQGKFTTSTGSVRNFRISRIFDFIDANATTDDRVAVTGIYPTLGANPGIQDFDIQGVYVYVASTVTSGTVNAVKIDSNSTYIHGFSIRDVHQFANSNVATNNPVLMQVENSGQIQDYTVDGVVGVGTGRIKCILARAETGPKVIIRDVVLRNCFDTIFGIELLALSAPSGDEVVEIGPFNISGTATLGTDAPTAVGLVGIPTTTGGSGTTWVHDGSVQGMRGCVTNMVNESGTVSTSAWTNIKIDRVNMNGVTKGTTNMMGVWREQDCPGHGPSGNSGQRWGAVPASPGTVTNTSGRDAAVYLFTGAGVTVSVVALGGSTIAGVTMAQNSTYGPLRLPANQSFALTFAGGTPTYAAFLET